MNAPTKRTPLGIAAVLAWPALAVLAGYRYFNRSPARTIPAGAGVLVSPADGKVIHIERADTQRITFLKRDVLNALELVAMRPPYHVVVIELTLTDVHVQRAPLHGTVLAMQHYPGRFDNVIHSAGREFMANTNEKMLTVIGNPDLAVGVIQVAGMMARHIVPFVQVGQAVQKGQQIGMITLGSQVVLVLPQAAFLNVAVGQRLTDGETIVAFHSR